MKEPSMTTIDKPGSAAVHGRLWGARARDWADLQEGQHQAEYEAVFERLGLGPGALYCDVGCASGVAAQSASQRGAWVWGLDAADKLIEIARARVPSGDFRVGEMEELPFGDSMFDLVTGFRAFNYATRPVVALAEARRIVKQDGRIVMTTWGKPEGMGIASLINALTPLLPPRPSGAPGIFALSEEGALRSLAESAGLKPLTVDYIDCTWSYPDLATALRGFASSGRAVRAIECTSEQAVNQAHATTLAPFRLSDGSYRIGASLICLVARP
jgi:ubiquinone/menaquinone biosynthesis C-methylase UbiE